MLVVFPPTFLVNTKIIYGFNFVAPLNVAFNTLSIIWISTNSAFV